MARTNLLKEIGLNGIDLKSRWNISSNKKRLLDMILEKEKIKENFSLKDRKRFLVFSVSCEICKETGNWAESKKMAKDIVNNLDTYAIHTRSRRVINVFKEMLKKEKNGLSKGGKSSKEGDKQ